MTLHITSRTIDTELKRKVREISGEMFSKCFQCGTCAGSCPMVEHLTATPRRLMALLQAGQREALEQINTPWVCASCHTCMVRCPRGLDIPKIMEALRQMVLRKNLQRVDIDRIDRKDLVELPQIALLNYFRKLTL